jgi:hypothetical protein
MVDEGPLKPKRYIGYLSRQIAPGKPPTLKIFNPHYLIIWNDNRGHCWLVYRSAQGINLYPLKNTVRNEFRHLDKNRTAPVHNPIFEAAFIILIYAGCVTCHV